MKRYGYLFEKIYSMDNLQLAHQNARKGKGWYLEVKEVDDHIDYYLDQLQQMLINHTYHTSKYTKFIRKEGQKEREIYKLPYFPDRICQWAVLQIIEPILINHLSKNTYSAIPGRGIHAALNDIRKDIYDDPEGCQYCFKLDVKKFYPSINHKILKNMFRNIFKDPDLLWLLDEIIDSISTGDPNVMKDFWFPGEKIDPETGVPIGNYLSQYCGNFYLSGFDHWLKEDLGVAHSYRYMDDCVILGKSKEELHVVQKKVEQYFHDRLKLVVKDNWQIFPTYVRGIDFVGYRIFKDYTLLRKSTCKSFKKKMIGIRKKVETG